MPKQKNFKKRPDLSAFKNQKAFRGLVIRGNTSSLNARPRALGGHR